MQPNIGTIDSIVRIVSSLILFGIGLVFSTEWGLIGIVPLGGSLTRWSFLYKVMGINTYHEV